MTDLTDLTDLTEWQKAAVREHVAASQRVRAARERAVIMRGPLGDYLRREVRKAHRRACEEALRQLIWGRLPGTSVTWYPPASVTPLHREPSPWLTPAHLPSVAERLYVEGYQAPDGTVSR